MEQSIGGLGDTVKEFAVGFASALGVGLSLDKMIELGARSVETADKIQKMSQQVGIATDELSALQAQAQLSDVGFDQFGQAMTRLARSATEAAEGAKTQAAVYQAMGVSVKSAAGELRPMSDILDDVAKKMASYQDGAAKTALAQELFGRSGAQLIPLLNELGSQGFAKVREEAEAYNQVIGEDQAKASEQLHDNLVRVQMSVSGFANAVMAQLLPSLVELSGDMADGAKSADHYASSAAVLANAIKGLGLAFDVLVEAVRSAVNIVAASADTLGAVLTLPIKAAEGAVKNGMTGFKSAFTDAFSDIRNSWSGAASGLTLSWSNVANTFHALFGAKVPQDAQATAEAAKKVAPPLIDAGNAAENAGKQAREMDAAFDALQGTLDALAGKLGGPYIQAEAQYLDTLTKIENQAEAFVIAGGDVNTALKMWQEGEELAADALEQTTEQIEQQHNLFAQQALDLREVQSVLALEPQYRDAATAALKKYDELLKSHFDFYGNYIQDEKDLKAALDDQLPAYTAGIQHVKDLTDAQQANDQATKDWINIWQQAGSQLADTFAKILVEGGSLFDSLVSLAKQTVEQIIAYFAKLAIINPILNSIFGGSAGFSLLPTLGSAASSAFGGGASITGAEGSTGNSFGTVYNAGKTLWDGFSSGFSGGDSAFTMGPPTEAGSTSSYYGGGYSSGFGQALGIAGGVYAGYNEFNRAGGGAAGLAGGAAYGYGTYAAGAGIATLAATGSLTAAFAAIPVIGWIAIAAMLIDQVSGGKLFGTKGQVQEGSTTLNIGPGGADYATQVSLKGQKALFGGAKWSTQDIAETPEQKEAAQAYFDAMTKQMKQYADQFGAKAGDLVTGSFQQVFDKKGNLTGETHATIAGYNYDNLTADQFSQAYTAANQLAVLDQFDAKLEDTIATYRKSADTLVQIANGLTMAEGYLKSGGDFLAIAGKDTLSSIVTLAEGMQQSGETIDQTIQRLIQAQQQYDQFVAQFKPAPTFASSFQATLAGIDTQMQQNIATANALAKAAGAEGASTEDLVNIHKYAAAQFAAAVAQLKASSNSLAASLGYALPQNLDDINSEIAQLESQAGAGARAVGNFGSAMQTAAQRATDAMNLLLGDLSPYNDQQKLQMALQGQMAGTVTPQQVLEIARRLDATGADYKAIFDQVMAIGDRTNRQNAGASGGGGGGGLSAADQKRLADLKAERDQLEASKRHADAMQLAQNVADIASSTGESIDQVLTDLGITDIGPFLKDLGLNDKQSFDDLIAKLEKSTDSAGDNTQQIASRLDLTNTLLTQIRDGTTGAGGTGHSGHSDPRAINDNTRALDDNTAATRDLSRGGGFAGSGVGAPQLPGSRSTRQPAEIPGSRTR